MSTPSILCPGCGRSISLDETLAAPIIAEVQAKANQRVKEAEDKAESTRKEVLQKESQLAERAKALADQEAMIQTKVNQQLASERAKIADQERKNAKAELAPEITQQQEQLKALQTKLAESQTKSEQRVKAAEEAAAKSQQELLEKAATLAAREKTLADQEASIQTKVNQQLAAERLKIAEEERKNAEAETELRLQAEQAKQKELLEKLQQAQKNELELRQQRDAIEARAKQIDLEIAQRVDAQRKDIQELAQKSAEEAMHLRFAEKDKVIADMQEKLAEAQRKATQVSQQLQGDVLELDIETLLRAEFPQDTVEPVKAGARGGDILQHVLGQMGRPAGTIFWETKRALSWGGDWCAKAKMDCTMAKAELAVIVSEMLPKGVSDFGLFDGVWVTRPSFAVMLGLALRHGVICTSEARQGAIGKETKAEMLYNYMTGPQFRAMLEGIALPFRELHDELNAERRATMARWKRQERRIERVLSSVAGLQGDLQGIAGSEMPALPAFEDSDGTQEEE